MTVDQLRSFLQTLDEVTLELEKALVDRDTKENDLKISKTHVEILKNKRDLVKEKIMAEKVLIKEIR